jgi:hypothetical protein
MMKSILTERVVGAADRLLRATRKSESTHTTWLNNDKSPRSASDANHIDGAAGETDVGGEAADDDAQKVQETQSGTVQGLRILDALAALERPSVALVAGSGARGRGGSKGCHCGDGGESGEFELHVGCDRRA